MVSVFLVRLWAMRKTNQSAALPIMAALPQPTAPQNNNGGRSPGLILLVAALALFMISLQSLSEVSELLLQHVDDALLEDGALFTSINLGDIKIDAVMEYDEDEVVEHRNNNKKDSPAAVSKNFSKPKIKEEFTQLVMKEDDAPIVLNVGFVTYKDKYKVIDTWFEAKDLDMIMSYVTRVWSAAKIQINFTKFSNIQVDDARTDGYRWLVMGSKDQKHPTKFWKDVNLYLRKTSTKLSAHEISEIIAKYFQYSGYPLVDWVLDARKVDPKKFDFDVAIISHWPWMNGGNLGSRLIVRSANCDFPPRNGHLRTRRTDLVVCNGWSRETRDLAPMSPQEAARIVAHLIGRRLGLRQAPRDACEGETTRLMCRATSGTSVWWGATRLDAEEIRKARTNARLLVLKRTVHHI